MLTCITCTKHSSGGSTRGNGSAPRMTLKQQVEYDYCEDGGGIGGTPSTRQAIKALTAQIKDMAMKASGAYKSCKACSGSNHSHHDSRNYMDSENVSDSAKFSCYYQRNESSSSSSTPRLWGKEMEGRLKVFASGETTPVSVSGRTESAVFVEEDEPREWVAQVEPGILITFVSLPQGGNELRRIRFSGELFNKWQAQRWWTENYDKVMELYNIRRSCRQGAPCPATPPTEDEVSRVKSLKDGPVTPPLDKERLPQNIQHPATGIGYSSSDSVENCRLLPSHPYSDTASLATTKKLSSISGAKMETSSVDGSVLSEEEAEHSGELSLSNASDMDSQLVEQDEPGVYITIRALSNGTRELRRVRFRRERFGEMQARVWWEQNRERIQQQYLRRPVSRKALQ